MKNYTTILWRNGLLFLAFAVAAASPARAETNLYSGNIWNLVDAKKVMAAAADITPDKYPDSDTAIVERRMERLYHADGTGLSQDESFVKALTEKGKRAVRTIGVEFMLPYARDEVTTLEIIKPDGTVTPVDIAANSKESIDDSQMSENIYDPHLRVIQVNIPGVEVGDVVHSVTREIVDRAIMPGEFSDQTLFEDSGYIRHMSYEVHAPADRPLLRVALRDEIWGTVKYTHEPDAGGGVVHHWEVDNVPRMFDEPAMPPYDQVLQRLVVSTTPDWQAVSKWYWNVSIPHLEATSPEMTNEVRKLTADCHSEMDKIKAVFYDISKNIRYMGVTPETNRPGFEPHDVNLTYEKKYGVCRDKAALLVSMLRTAGLKSYPVLINIGAKRDPDVASVDFNHAIVSVQLTNGQYILMDPTDEHTRDLLPAGDCNRSFLVCRPEGEKLQTSPVQPPEEHMMRITTTGVLTAAGSLEAKSELEFNGINDDEYRNAFSHMKPDDRRRFFERDLNEMMPGAHLKSIKFTPEDMMDTSQTLRAEIKYSAEGMTATGNGKAIVSMPWIGNHVGIINFILGGAGLEKRKYPMQTFVACGLQENVSLKLEGGFRGAVSLPECEPIDDPCSLYHETFSAKDGELNASREMMLKTVEFSPSQYLTLKKELKALQYDARKAPLMAVSDVAGADPVGKIDPVVNNTVSSDAEVLDSHKEIDVIDAHTCVLKAGYSKKILTYAGKIREAEFKVGYNPACESVKLISAVVTSKDGKCSEVSPGEINIMDAGWNASAKRYTGGKILVASLPSVEIGSTIAVEYEVTSTNKPFIAGYEYFHFPDGLDQKKVVLTAPAGVAVREFVSGKKGLIKAQAHNDEKTQTFEWQAENVPGQAAESSLPPAWAYNDGVSYFVGDMKEYLKTLDGAMASRAAPNDKVHEVVQGIISPAKSKLENAQAIRDYVAKSIRLAGPTFSELPLSELSPAEVTLSDGYGHAADRAILLSAMFTAAGFQPEFVLASGLPPINGITNVADTFPLPEWFQNPLVKVNIDGVNYYFNDTDQYARLGAAPNDGDMSLNLASAGPEVVHAAADCSDKIDTDYTLAASDNGLTRITVSRHYYGGDYDWKHKYFAELPPEERRRYYQEEVSGIAQGARPVGDLITQFDTYPGLEQFTVDVDNYSVVDGKYLYFELPFMPSLYGSGPDQRTLPLFLSRRNVNSVHTEIQLPPGFPHVVMAPPSVSLSGPDDSGTAHISATDSPGKYVLTEDFETDPSIVDAKDYPDLLKLEASLGRKSSRVFLLQKD